MAIEAGPCTVTAAAPTAIGGRASTVVAPFTAVGVAASTAAVQSMEEVVSAAKHNGSILLCNQLSCFRLLAISER
ncbi:hypothetical protein MSPGM_00480 [Methylorubrum sp. GM97]|nr:hypothetical protein MSPGM_00480 [Methylorubrum sp. GM97]